jgi:signal transduction histidine kinase
VEICGDPNRLNQVLVNLIGNAIKFTNEGGIKVNVSTPTKEKLSIQVADSGLGIPPEQLPDIFEAFRRGSNYIHRERQGAGLGLSIAKEIITRMGGEISVASEPGQGSIFTVLLPMDAV